MRLNNVLRGAPEWELSLVPRLDQLEDLDKLLQWDKAANYSEVGTGKSLVSYLYITKKLLGGKGVLVVMPPPLIPQYLSNFNSFIPQHNFSFEVLHENKSKRHDIMDTWDAQGWPDVLFMSYQMYKKYAKTLQSVRKYQVLVADEAHMVSNCTNKTFQTLFMHVYARDLDLLLMTATPTTTELQTAYGQIRLKTPRAYSGLSQFERMHCEFAMQPIDDKKSIKTVVGYKDIDGINAHLMRQAVRRRARDVLSLQEPTIIDHQVYMDPEHSELYRVLLEQWMLELGDELLVARNKQALRQMALQVITNLQKYTLDEVVDSPMDNLMAIMESIDLTKTKLIIFCNFRNTVVKLSKALKQYHPALIYGASNTEQELQKLLTDTSCRVGILNFQSGGAGFNLQSVAHHIVIYEAIGSPGMVQQAIGRVYRGGQEYPVIAWIFRYARTMSAELLKKNYRRAGEIKQSLSDTTCFVDFMTTGDFKTIRELLGL